MISVHENTQVSSLHPRHTVTAYAAATWNALCEASQERQDLGADWVRESGELIIGCDWLSESGITDAEQLDITATPGVVRLQLREDRGFWA